MDTNVAKACVMNAAHADHTPVLLGVENGKRLVGIHQFPTFLDEDLDQVLVPSERCFGKPIRGLQQLEDRTLAQTKLVEEVNRHLRVKWLSSLSKVAGEERSLGVQAESITAQQRKEGEQA